MAPVTASSVPEQARLVSLGPKEDGMGRDSGDPEQMCNMSEREREMCCKAPRLGTDFYPRAVT